MSRKYVVIYSRFSSEMQRAESCDDQEREVRSALERRGIESQDAIVIRDEAESGTKSDRAGFQRLITMRNAGEIAILVVDDQSRLTRGENALAFIKDLVFSGGRFLSTSENIDTGETGWELKVKVMELHHGETIRGLREKVRRGQSGRVLADDSAGDYPFGYESFYRDPDWQQQLARRGPKPKKGIRINDNLAEWVRKIFAWFVGGQSTNAIARRLTKEGAPKGNRATTAGWHPQQVHRILTNPKYVGLWRWGETTTIRDSRGRTKQIPVAAGDVVTRERPLLRIVDQDVWDRAQLRLRELQDVFGQKPGQAKRGPKAPINSTALYPRSILGNVLRCASCGQVMWYKGSGGRRYYSCSGYTNSRCDQSFQVPADVAETAVVNAISHLVAGWPEWIREVHARLKEQLIRAAKQIPVARAEDERRLAERSKQRDNLVDALSQGGAASSGIVNRITTIEREIAEIEARLESQLLPSEKDLELPSEQWVREQIADWSQSLSDRQKVAMAIREALKQIDARPVIAPGKKRGYVELTLHYQAWELFRTAIGKAMPLSVQNLLPKTQDVSAPPMEVIALGEPTAMDRWAPEIARWREEGVIWEEIVRRTGMDLNRVYLAWKRYTEAEKSA